MKDIKDISTNSLEELFSLIAKIQADIDDYSHVSDYLPIELKADIQTLGTKYWNEINKRQRIIKN